MLVRCEQEFTFVDSATDKFLDFCDRCRKSGSGTYSTYMDAIEDIINNRNVQNLGTLEDVFGGEVECCFSLFGSRWERAIKDMEKLKVPAIPTSLGLRVLLLLVYMVKSPAKCLDHEL